jgi:dethiobiotin synthetase
VAELNVVEGRLSVVVEGAGGSADYLLEELPGPPFRLRLTRLDEPGRSYVVEERVGGWRCPCADHRYRGRVCKHITAARSVKELLGALRGREG